MTNFISIAKKNMKGDPIIWLVIIVLSCFSILFVYSAVGALAYKFQSGNTEFYLLKHSSLVILSLFVTLLFHKIDYRYYSRVSLLLLIVSVPLLTFTWLFGTNINEASRWFTIPGINIGFQPSDIAKIALIVSLASMLAKKQTSLHDFKRSIIPMFLWIGVICGLIALTNISSAILLFLTCLLLLFIGRVAFKKLLLLMGIVLVCGFFSILVGQRGATAMSRINSYLNDDVPYQLEQSYIAIASGNIFGKGLGMSSQKNYLPHSYSDFIYAIIVEETGLVIGVLVVLLYIILLYRGMKVAENTQRPFGGLLSAGLTFALVIQAFVNIAVTVGLAPITGLTLPFLSMGGTSQLFSGIAVGMILSVSKDNKLKEVA